MIDHATQDSVERTRVLRFSGMKCECHLDELRYNSFSEKPPKSHQERG